MLNKKLLGSVSSAPATYVEDVFSTYLYTGTGASLSIDNGIDLAGEGGLIWFKRRDAAGNNSLSTTGITGRLLTDTTGALNTNPLVDSYNSNGFSTVSSTSTPNQSGGTFASWTFRKQPKFFDVVTWTGDGAASRSISHSLASQPGMIMFKKTSATSAWDVLARNGSLYYSYLQLNTTGAALASTISQSGAASSTTFKIDDWNDNGATYVAYLFAHDAGGFGTSGTDNVISCGSFTCNGSGNATINLGYEPQYLMTKKSSTTGNWNLIDSMRGFPVPTAGSTAYLTANTSDPEYTGTQPSPTATGFTVSSGGANTTYIYMAIRRPMKVPTDATTVFNTNIEASSANPQTLTTGFPVDLTINSSRTSNGGYFIDRLRGSSTSSMVYLQSVNTNAEATNSPGGIGLDNNTGIVDSGWYNSSGAIYWSLSRRPGFFDVVCYTGTGGLLTLNHNLSVAPELIILKARGTNSFATSNNWFVYCSYLSGTPTNQYLKLNATSAVTSNTYVFGNAAPTSTTFGAGGAAQMDSGVNAVAYLFATCAGVSKVGTYTGTGSAQTINCGFTGGARFVLIKRTDSTGDWFVWDTARGMVSGTDPSLSLNSTAAEVNANSVYTATTGFQIVSTAAGINASGGSYIYLAIA